MNVLESELNHRKRFRFQDNNNKYGCQNKAFEKMQNDRNRKKLTYQQQTHKKLKKRGKNEKKKKKGKEEQSKSLFGYEKIFPIWLYDFGLNSISSMPMAKIHVENG